MSVLFNKLAPFHIVRRKVQLTLFCVLGVQFVLYNCSCRSSNTPVPYFAKGPGQRKLIMFVHGVLGDMDNTWMNPVTHVSWPELIASDPDLKDFDVFVYGYSSPKMGGASNIQEISDRLGQELRDRIFAHYEEVDFITHSMGGIITKRMLNTLNTPSENVNLNRVHCVIYLAVPSNGAETAALASWLSYNPQFKSMSPQAAADFLQAVEGDWGALLRARNASSPFPRTYSAYEKLQTAGFQVVPRLYTSQIADAPVLGFDYDHIDIVKPRDRDNEIYRWAKARIQEASAYPVQRPNLVEALVHQVDHLRGDFEASPSNNFLRLKANSDAARVASQAQYIDDAGLDLANRIAKYEYGAYAFVIAASTDTNPIKRKQFVRSSLNFCDRARVALKDLDERTSSDEEAKRARTWAAEDQPKDRVAFLATMAWCVDYSTGSDINSRRHARDEWAQVIGSFRDQYKDSTPELVNCVLPSRSEKRSK